MALPSALRRFVDLPALRADPLAFFRSAQAAGEELVVISEREAIFSRAKRCAGAVAAFGPKAIRQVLGDAAGLSMPVSIGERFALPPRLKRLNFGLFSMRGDQHRTHQQLLLSALGPGRITDYCETIARGWTAFSEDLQVGEPISLLVEMRRLVLNISHRVIFGHDDLQIGRLIQTYFDCRRSLKTMRGRRVPEARRELLRIGTRLDRMLHDRVTALRALSSGGHPTPRCILADLMRLDREEGRRLSDDDLIGHANVLFMSSSEPIAVALTWTLLLLSQDAQLRAALRQEVARACGRTGVPLQFVESELPLLHASVRESLRLLPPNAIMVRLTGTAVDVLGHRLPADCELVVSPYVAQRDPTHYADPDAFDPRRWQGLKPSPYAYFPFGVGARYCMGRHLAGHILVYVLARILERFDVILAQDQNLDWKMDITLMPASDPILMFLAREPDAPIAAGGRLRGPVSELVKSRSGAAG